MSLREKIIEVLDEQGLPAKGHIADAILSDLESSRQTGVDGELLRVVKAILARHGSELSQSLYIAADQAIQRAEQPQEPVCAVCSGNGAVGMLENTIPCPACTEQPAQVVDAHLIFECLSDNAKGFIAYEHINAVLEAIQRATSAKAPAGEPAETSDAGAVRQWHLDGETAKFLADLINGNDEPTPVTLYLGPVKDDDGKVQHGLCVYETEYPEEGASLLVECAAAPHPKPEAGEKVCEWRATFTDATHFRHQCCGDVTAKVGDYCPHCGGKIVEVNP